MEKSKVIPREYEVKLVSVKELYSGVKLFNFSFESKFNFIPGQFIMFEMKDALGNNVKRSYSISSSPESRNIELVMNIIPGGKMTSMIDRLKVGEKIKLIGPHGKFGNQIGASKGDIMFIAAGTGITPIRSMINSLLKNKFDGKITLLYGFRHEQNFLFKEEFEELADSNKNFILIPTISQPVNAKRWTGSTGRATEWLNKNISSRNLNQDFYICGLAQMVKDTKEILLKKGVKAEQIHIEAW